MAIEITSDSLAGTQPEPSGPAPRKASFSGFSTTNKRRSGWRIRVANSRWTRRNFSSRAGELSAGDLVLDSEKWPHLAFLVSGRRFRLRSSQKIECNLNRHSNSLRKTLGLVA